VRYCLQDVKPYSLVDEVSSEYSPAIFSVDANRNMFITQLLSDVFVHWAARHIILSITTVLSPASLCALTL